MRSPLELIRELEQEARQLQMTALVIGFQDHTAFVWSHHADKLETLDTMLTLGGESIGFVGVTDGTITVRPLAEYENEEWARGYLQAILRRFQDVARAECSRPELIFDCRAR